MFSKQYVFRAVDDTIVPCGPGAEGLTAALACITDATNSSEVGLIERGELSTSVNDWYGEVIACGSRDGFFGLGDRGRIWITRAMTTGERHAVNFFSQKLSWLDLTQATVSYTAVGSDLQPRHEYERGCTGLHQAMRTIHSEGWGLIVRRIEGILGEQAIACFTHSGYWFTYSADERERAAVVNYRESLEDFNELRPVLDLSDQRVKDRIIASLNLCVGLTPLEQASLFHNFNGRIPA